MGYSVGSSGHTGLGTLYNPLPQGWEMRELAPTETKALFACGSQSPEMVLWSGQRVRAEWRGQWLRSHEAEGVGMRQKAGGGGGSWGSES